MAGSNSIPEAELLRLTANGDRSAFAELFERYHQELGSFIVHITKSVPTAEEIVLDVFLKLWISRETLSNITNFRSYLFVLARNAAISELRKTARQKLKQKQYQTEYMLTEPEDRDDKEVYLSIIDEAIANLSPQRKKIFLMSRQQGMKYEDIARELRLSKLTVRAHIQQAVEFIARFVKDRAGNNLAMLWILIDFL